MDPAQRILIAHLQAPEFTSGAAQGWWGFVDDGPLVWPLVLIWLAAPKRGGAPDRFYFRLDFSGYPNQPPTGNVADPVTGDLLPVAQRPRGRENSRFAKVFRIDWENAKALYHPFDRHAASSHAEWPTNNPGKRWTPAHTVTDWVTEFHTLFHSEDYIGV